MRIVGGKRKGRRLDGPADESIRPTSDRAREALFNLLSQGRWRDEDATDLHGAKVLDGFCGTGALGLEAVSRGAGEVTFMDKSREALALARKNAQGFEEDAALKFILGDVCNPPTSTRAVDFALLDPPYGEGLLPQALTALARRGWLHPGAIAVAELASREEIETPEGFTLLDERRYGKAKLMILRKN